MKFKSAILGAALIGASLAASAANAAVYEFTFTDTIDTAQTPGISAGDVFTLHLYADNGGSTVVNQTWDLADLQGFTIEAGTYSASYSKVWMYPATGNFITDGAGVLTHVEFYGTDDASSNVDNFGAWIGDTVFGGASFVDFNGNNNTTVAGSFNNASKWTVSAAGDVGGVPEPATWALMISGFGMAGSALRRRVRVAA